MEEEKLTAAAPPMVLFHSDEYSPFGLDTEFEIPIKKYTTGTRDFCPGLCLKKVVHGSCSQLSSVYVKQIECTELSKIIYSVGQFFVSENRTEEVSDMEKLIILSLDESEYSYVLKNWKSLLKLISA